MELQQIINDKEIRIDFRELLYNLDIIHHQALIKVVVLQSSTVFCE
jgi:hypothetical protein